MNFFRYVLNYFDPSIPTLHNNDMEKQPVPEVMYTEEQLMARLKFFIGVCLALTLTGIVFVVLYSLIFVTQPLNAISPIDQKFFELIVPIATFLTGTLSGIMLAGGDKDAQKMALQAATKGSSPTPPMGGMGMPGPMGGVPPMNPMGGMSMGGMQSPMMTRPPMSPMGNVGMGTAMAAGALSGAAAGLMARQPQPNFQPAFSSGEFEPGQSPKFTDT